ncbi:MAG TPA: dethiobiotin synthase [Acidimicrobiia bacterium]|nr:dethiobiotin synthase [Acidimicrobiia bacterium]
MSVGPEGRGGGERARPRCLAFVTGTATEIGKTWWTAAVARALDATGSRVALRKPVQSCDPDDVTDAEILAAATGDDADAVTPAHRTYRVAWAPPMAADHLGQPPFRVAELVEELSWPTGTDIGLVEGVGGPRSPVASDGDNVTMIDLLDPDVVVLVADAGLGTVNAVRLAAAALTTRPLVVALNRYAEDELHERNRAVLVSDGLTVVTTPAELAAMLRRFAR